LFSAQHEASQLADIFWSWYITFLKHLNQCVTSRWPGQILPVPVEVDSIELSTQCSTVAGGDKPGIAYNLPNRFGKKIFFSHTELYMLVIMLTAKVAEG